MSRLALRFVATLSLAVLGAATDAGLALAQQSSTTASDEEARNLFAAGQTAFNSGSYERALAYFEQAYALSHRVGLLYNIAVAADRVRSDERALEAFRRYLEGEPETTLRAEVEARIAYLERAIAEREASSDVAPPPPTLDPVVTTASADPTPSIALLVAGGVVVVTGGVLLGVAAGEQSAVESAMPGAMWRDYSGHHDAAEALAIAGGVSLGVGAVLAVLGALAWPSGTSESRASVRLGARGLSGCF